jgi:hypothetical protein
MALPSPGDFRAMKHQTFTMGLQLVCALVAVALLTGAAAAATTTGSSTGGQIAVKSITKDPDVFMPWDTGTIRVQIQNTGTGAVTINTADIMSGALQTINYRTYDKVGSLGAGDSLELTFNLKANGLEGLYFPELYLDLGDSGSMRYPIPVRVDGTGVLVSVMDVPDSFVQGEGNPVVLAVSNPRKNNVTSVTIIPRGEGIRSTQTSIFVGSLQPDGMKNVTFEITPERSTDLTFDVTYSNGMNRHATNITIPISIGERSMTSSPVVNNVEVSQAGGTYTVKGDVTNAGLSDAKSVVATMGNPAQPVDPNKIYVIGALEPDDFSSFELTFTAPGASSVPLVIQYKDTDGKSFETTVDISLRAGTSGSTGSSAATGQQSFQGSSGRSGGTGMMGFGNGLRNFPLTEIILVIIGCIALAIAWKKVIGPKLRARKRQKAQK